MYVFRNKRAALPECMKQSGHSIHAADPGATQTLFTSVGRIGLVDTRMNRAAWAGGSKDESDFMLKIRCRKVYG